VTSIEELRKHINDLESDDRHAREKARFALVQAGRDATPLLIDVLTGDTQRCRWEAARVLADIKDPASAPDLVEALIDDSIEVHWAASEALIALGRDAIIPVLKGIVSHFDSYRFRQGAYHVLHTLERSHQLDIHSRKVLEALRDVESSIKAPWAAEQALEILEIQRR
jgi:HEAT repeat protein